MLPYVRLVPNPDGTCDIYLEYDKRDNEFAREWFGKEPDQVSSSLLQIIRAHARKARIRSVKIFASGALISTVALSSVLPSSAAGNHYIMGYLYQGTEQQYYESGGRTAPCAAVRKFCRKRTGGVLRNPPV